MGGKYRFKKREKGRIRAWTQWTQTTARLLGYRTEYHTTWIYSWVIWSPTGEIVTSANKEERLNYNAVSQDMRRRYGIEYKKEGPSPERLRPYLF